MQCHGIHLTVKRDDLLHPDISGNKWRKLKYNMEAARQAGKAGLLTFGGAYSNHLAATAAAGKRFGFKTLGFVRGEPHTPLNPTLAFAQSCGMDIRYLDREAYRLQCHGEGMNLWEQDYWILPEGGSNLLALKGCAELARECHDDVGYWPDYLCVCAGTGATAAGLICGLPPQTRLLAFSVLKGGFMHQEIQKFLDLAGQGHRNHWQVVNDYHFGGYARFNGELIGFINQSDIPLDPVYTGKMFYGVDDLAKKGFFPEGASVMLIHSGGLQGIAGFNQRFGKLIE